MSYDRAEEILPEELIKAIQQYVSGKSIYIPSKEKKSWGSQTKTRQYYQKRNEEIRRKYADGISVKTLAEEYALTGKSIQRILRTDAPPDAMPVDATMTDAVPQAAPTPDAASANVVPQAAIMPDTASANVVPQAAIMPDTASANAVPQAAITPDTASANAVPQAAITPDTASVNAAPPDDARPEQEKYLQGLRQWLRDTEDVPLEEMSEFFANRLDGYEEHMSVWEKSYRLVAEALPGECRKILDLGCGTGLELDQIWKKNPDIEVTGVDLCRDMLDKLLTKHPDKRFTAVCRDYFQYDPGREQWDAVISFESLHHFLPERKRELYRKIYRGVKPGGVFILGDYIACCDEEEILLRDVYLRRRRQSVIPEDRFVHFDIPLTMEHETALLQSAGFRIENVIDEDAAVLVCRKAET